ncbi:MAG: DUF839 domain-containing protein [Cyclobacteriaceae bacterium]
MKSRRKFVKQSFAVSAGFLGLSSYLAYGSAAPADTFAQQTPWLELPEGFDAHIISRWGETMADGLLVPGRADGMAAFAAGDKVTIVRNHENSPGDVQFGPFGDDLRLLNKVKAEQFFDYGFGKTPGMGGTTTLTYDEASGKVIEQHLSSIGTYRNCAGGATPWGSWISCEEDTTPAGDESQTAHGYNFEIPAQQKGLIEPLPIRAMGRFNHEAVAVSPLSGIVYQTEDQNDGLIYRYLPNVAGQLHKGGQLQALMIKGQPTFDTRNVGTQRIPVGEAMEVEWVSLQEVEPLEDDLRHQGAALGAAIFARGEGMWYGNDEVYFACTNGGQNQTGQVFKYVPSPFEGTAREAERPGQLILFAEPNDKDILKYCDNLTVSPWGDVILVEDTPDAYIRGITPDGHIYNIGRNVGSTSELAGICFSPSGDTLFVNIQEEGLTFAITGPWDILGKDA